MPQHATDPGPMPPELALDEAPLSDEVLDRLDAAFGQAEQDGIGLDQWAALYRGADPIEDPDAPAAAHLVPDEARGWSISDDGAAEWAMRHVAQIDTELGELTERRDEWQRRIDHWFAQRSGTLLRRRSFFAAHLIAYGAARREANPKAAKTLSLPSGRITSSDRAATVRVVSDDVLAEWLRERELLVGPDGAEVALWSAKVYAAPLRKVLVTDGEKVGIQATGELLDELPPGLVIEPAHTVFDVKPDLG